MNEENIFSPCSSPAAVENTNYFYVNKDGFPMQFSTWRQMCRFAAKKHPNGKNVIKDLLECAKLEEIPPPEAPILNHKRIENKLQAVQQYIYSLQYNHTGTQFFDIRKDRTIIGHSETAKAILRECLPIKCLEAVILAVFLTSGLHGLERFAIGFKSCFNNSSTHKHVVLGVYYGGMYGAIGISRRESLGYKPLKYTTLTALIEEFEQSYNNVHHQLLKVAIGLPISHDNRSFEQINWKYLTLQNFHSRDRERVQQVIERYAKDMRTKLKTSSSIRSSLKRQISSVVSSDLRNSLGKKSMSCTNIYSKESPTKILPQIKK